jgi:hypothetical protein
VRDFRNGRLGYLYSDAVSHSKIVDFCLAIRSVPRNPVLKRKSKDYQRRWIRTAIKIAGRYGYGLYDGFDGNPEPLDKRNFVV